MESQAFELHLGDCIAVLKTIPDNSIDSVVTDPPYGIRFMGKAWDGKDIEERAAYRASMPSHAAACGSTGGHRSVAAEAGKYDLTPAAMIAFQAFTLEWAAECLRVLKPGGHLLSFSSARTYHHMAVGIEMAGFEIRDQIMWVFGSGFPKSQNVSKAMDKAAGAERQVLSEGKAVKRMIPGADQDATGSWIKDNGREYVPTVTAPATDAAQQWDGWGTALKPAHEPICMARKPLIGTVVANVLAYGTGAINIDGCRIEGVKGVPASPRRAEQGAAYGDLSKDTGTTSGWDANAGRFPANLIHDGSDEVVALFPAQAGASAPVMGTEPTANGFSGPVAFSGMIGRVAGAFHGDSGSAARFFYCAKTSPKDRHEGLAHPGPQFTQGTTLRKVEKTDTKGNNHPTVKPTDLMAYLCRLVTPPGGTVLDPFVGSGSTGKAAMREGFNFIGIDMEEPYIAIARSRIEHELAKRNAAPCPSKAQHDLFAAE